MFYYVFSLSGLWVYDDIRVVEDRNEAIMFRRLLKLPMRVVAK